MTVDKFIEPIEVSVGKLDCMISKIPAFTAKPVYLELVLKLRDYGEIGKTLLDETAVRTLLKYCAVKNPNGDWVVLETTGAIEALLPNHKDFLELQLKQQEHNFGFLSDGSLRSLLEGPQEAGTESVS